VFGFDVIVERDLVDEALLATQLTLKEDVAGRAGLAVKLKQDFEIFYEQLNVFS
jgi:hypothetical protein